MDIIPQDWDKFVTPEWLKTAGIVVGIVVTPLIAIAALHANYKRNRLTVEDRIIRQLLDSTDRPALKQRLEAATFRDAWRNRIVSLIGWLDSSFGPPVSYSAFDLCLRIAVVYPIALFSLAWLAGASGAIGNVIVMPVQPEFWRRLLALAAIILVSAIYYAVISRSARILGFGRAAGRRLSEKIRRRSQTSPVVRKTTGDLGGVIGGFLALAFAVAVAGAGAGAVAVAFAVAGAVAVAVAGAGAGAVAVAFAVADSRAAEVVVIMMMFFVILPVANAMLDFASWAATRWLLKKIARERAGWISALAVISEIAIDLFIAAVCLVVLAIAMATLIECLNRFLEWRGMPSIDWRGQVTAAMQLAPWRPANWTLLGMLASTVFPTALHLAAGTTGILFALLPNGRAIALRIQDTMSEGERQSVAADLNRLGNLRRSVWIGLTAVFLAGLLWLLWVVTGENIGRLYDIADWAARWVRTPK